jgi:hypothetical protein
MTLIFFPNHQKQRMLQRELFFHGTGFIDVEHSFYKLNEIRFDQMEEYDFFFVV